MYIYMYECMQIYVCIYVYSTNLYKRVCVYVQYVCMRATAPDFHDIACITIFHNQKYEHSIIYPCSCFLIYAFINF